MITENDIIFDHLYDEFESYMNERIPEIEKNTRYKEGISSLINSELLFYMEEYGLEDGLVKKLWEAYNEKKK